MSDSLIRVEYNSKPSKTIRVYKCAAPGCATEVRIRDDNKSHSGMCQTHSHQKRPYESIYKCFLNDWRKLGNTITYEEFLDFTKVPNCCYCSCLIPWIPYSTVGGEYTSRAYFLDRKDNSLGYSKENCVVCCTSCNMIKRDLLTHDEMLVAMKAVLEYRKGSL
jgi:hypothetical protein